MQFRTDINGLRAYAVLAVMLFHFNKDWLPGGFVGVDVFFVISGYLMTSIIFRGLNNHSFSILKFYAARIRRIIPALLVLVVLLIALGYFLFGPMSYRNIAKEAIRSLLFVSNFLYWRDSGYFDAGALSKPLLHTWSLSVEWQFYIIYPIILAVFAKLCSLNAIKKGIIAATVISLLFSAYFSSQSPTASYFLLPTRIWEMLLGGLIFLYPLQLSKNSHKYALEILGITLIFLSTFIISENTPWPGYMALLPTFGAFILMQANGSSILTNNIVFQKVGLWSYSLYLYHWPIIFINHRYHLDMSVWVFLTLSFILAILSYYLVEQRKWKVKYIIIAVCIALIPIYGVYKTKGAAFRVVGKYSLTAEEFNQQYYGGRDFPSGEASYTNPKPNNEVDYITIGDSYARQLSQYMIHNNISARTWFANGCLFTSTDYVYVDKKEFKECSQFVLDFNNSIIDKQISDSLPLIWTQSWDFYSLKSRNDAAASLANLGNTDQYHQKIINSIDDMIQKNPHRNIYLVGVYTRPNYNIYECLSTQNLSRFITESCAEFIPEIPNPINIYIKKAADQYPNVHFIDPDKGLCSEQGCRMLINNEPMFSDAGHLSTYGADIVGKYIFDEVKKYEANQQATLKQD